MTELVFGDEKKPMPIPIKIKSRTIKYKGMFIVIKDNIINPAVMQAIPRELKNLEPILSERCPARGDKTAIVIGVVARINPVLSGENPRMSIKKKDIKKDMEKIPR